MPRVVISSTLSIVKFRLMPALEMRLIILARDFSQLHAISRAATVNALSTLAPRERIFSRAIRSALTSKNRSIWVGRRFNSRNFPQVAFR